METFRMKYLRSCDDTKVAPSDFVLQNLKEHVGEDKENGRLDLSGCSLSVEDCNALAKCLTTDTFFSEIRLSDCLLTEDACTLIINALNGNRKLRKLDLKGNNIRYRGADAVGKLLKRTVALTHLRLEWNSLGMWDSGVKSIAEGLSLNQTLKFLDMRNNQISHEGATELAGALKRNRVLRTLDMRWNNVGIIGARAFLSTLKHNHTLTKFELGGNNVPADILKAVEAAVQRNSDRAAVYAEQEVVLSVVQQELTTLEHEKRLQVSSLAGHLAKEKELHNKFTKSAEEKIAQLKEALEAKSSSFSTLSTQYSTCESNLRVVEQHNRDLKGRLDNLGEEMKRKEGSYDAAISALKEQMEGLKRTSGEQQELLQSKVKEYENVYKESQAEVARLEEEVDNFRKAARKRDISHTEEMRDLEQKYKKEIESLRFLADDQKASMEERLKRLEGDNNRLFEETSRLKSSAQSDKLHFEEEKLHMTNKWKQDELLRSKQYEERISLLQTTKEELQSRVTKQGSEITDYISQVSKVSKELDQLKSHNTQLKYDLDEKEKQLRTANNEHRNAIDAERKEQTQLREKMTRLETDLSNLNTKCKEINDTKNAEIHRLQNQLEGKQADINRIREEELRRTNLLESAFQNYIASAKSPYKS